MTNELLKLFTLNQFLCADKRHKRAVWRTEHRINFVDRHLKKSFRFIFDLSKIYGIHFLMIVNPRFGMKAEPSFRNDGVYFDMTSPAFSFRKQGGFTSCHNEREYHLFYHLKRMEKLPKFYHFEAFIIFQRLFNDFLIDNHFETEIAFFIGFSAI